MGKGKKGGKRLTRKDLTAVRQTLFEDTPKGTFGFKQLFQPLNLDTDPLKMLAIDIMEDMAFDDYLTKVSETSFKLNTQGQVQEGKFTRKNNGKNVFTPDEGGQPVFVAERNSLFAMNGDRVRVTFMARRRNHIKEAMVTEILSHARDTFVGKLKVSKDYAFLLTESSMFVHDIFIPKNKLKGGKTDDKAVVKITEWPSREAKNPVGEVMDILGAAGENNTEMHAILAEFGLPYSYPKNVEDAADKISGEITKEDYAEREDYRDVTTFTIDPKDAKDFDDALSIRKLPSGLWEVGVHIADVSHYVTEGSVIDKEAVKRATSVYLVDRTIPMLPERLCNFICSLRPDEEKLAYSVIFKMNDKAEVKDFRIVHTIIRSKRRYCYEEVQELLEANGVIDGTGEPAPAETKEHPYQGENALQLITLDRLAKKLRVAI